MALLRILFLGDDPGPGAADAVRARGHEVDARHASSAEEAEAALRAHPCDLLVAAAPAPAFSALPRLHALRPGLPVILCGDGLGQAGLLFALRAGVYDVIAGGGAGLDDAVERVVARRRREEEEARTERLTAVARVAGGIAHDFNNLLGITLGYSDMILRRLPAGDPLRAKVMEIRTAAERAGGLTQQLMVFSRTRTVLAGTLDLGALVEGMGDILGRTLGPEVELVLRVAPGGARIRADRTQMAQVLTQLSSNARDAMPRGGRLVVECGEAPATGEDGGTGGAPVVRLSFADTGTGMEPEVQQRLFEPFFSTKPRTLARGLGLATVYRIVTQCGGRIEIASAPDRGTTVSITWPGLDASALAAPEPEAAGHTHR